MKTKIVALILLLVLSGCAGMGVIQAVPTAGGKLTVTRAYSAPMAPAGIHALIPPPPMPPAVTAAAQVPQLETLSFTQGDNANSPSTVEAKPDGSLRVSFGTVEKPTLIIPPAPDYTMYWCLAAGIVFLGGGIALACYGWPQIGTRLALAGGTMVILALTVKSYGWAYVLATAILAGWIAWEKYHAYKSGVTQTLISAVKA